MLKTKFDRWLIETFVYEHHIRVVHLPQKIPLGVKVSEISSKQYHFLLVAKNSKRANKLIADLTASGAVYSTRIVAANHWYNSLIFNKNKSFTFSVFWWTITIILVCYLYGHLKTFMNSTVFTELKNSFDQLLQNQ